MPRATPDTLLKVNTLTIDQKLAILSLWNNEYPKQLNYSDLNELEVYLEPLLNSTHYLLQAENQDLKGWAITFDRENERWFAIIISSAEQRKGYGAKLLEELKTDNSKLNGWVTDHSNYFKSNGEPYLSPLEFYLKSGFSTVPDQRIENDKLSAVKIRLD